MYIYMHANLKDFSARSTSLTRCLAIACVYRVASPRLETSFRRKAACTCEKKKKKRNFDVFLCMSIFAGGEKKNVIVLRVTTRHLYDIHRSRAGISATQWKAAQATEYLYSLQRSVRETHLRDIRARLFSDTLLYFLVFFLTRSQCN